MSGKERFGALRLSLPKRHALAVHLQEAGIPEDVRMEIMGLTPTSVSEYRPDHICKDCGTEKACPLCDERYCVLCGSPLLGSFGCDPRPLAYTGRCCHDCDSRRVMPVRGGLTGITACTFSATYRQSLENLGKPGRKQ